MNKHNLPAGELALQTVAMPANTNANGDIFGGWLVSNMDMAAAIIGIRLSRSRIVTVAIDNLVFIKPVLVGDTVGCYVEIKAVGRTSMKMMVEVWTESGISGNHQLKKVAQGLFTFVAINNKGKPQPVDRAK